MRLKVFALITLLSFAFMPMAHAGTITISTLSNDSQVSYSFLNTSFNTVKNCLNGNIESVNLKDATITVDDMASSSSPAQREGDHFNAYTKTGMQPATSADLTSDISAGTSYVESDTGLLYRVVIAATSKTYTASKDTWVYIDKNGTPQYTAQTVGLAQPTTPADSLLLAKVVTDADNITSVVDHRVTTISLGATEDFYVRGMELLWTASDRLSADTGIVRVGSSTVTKTSATGLNIGTAGDYITGASERGVSKWLYLYAGPSGSSNIKLDDNAPDYHDTSGNTAGKKYYFKNGTDYWRVLGRIRLNATGSGEIVQFTQSGNKVYNTDPQSFTCGTSATYVEVDLTSVCSPIDVAAQLLMSNTDQTAANSGDSFRSADSTSATSAYGAIHVNNSPVFCVGWLPIVTGTTYTKAIDYKQTGGTLTGYVGAVEMDIR